ncbi:MAG: hypothetical protein H6811_01295 [Phycisphaeraceae bacterium]|nr:hypothetical protein [Phycisphaeraceae bacterium]
MTIRAGDHFEHDDFEDRGVDSLLDSIHGIDASSRESALRGLDPDAARELLRTRAMLDAMRFEESAPDLTLAVLSRVQRRRRFLPRGLRRAVGAGRLATLLAVLAGLGAIAVLQRERPDLTLEAAQPAPLGDVVRAGQSRLNEGLQDMTVLVQMRAPQQEIAEARAVRANAPRDFARLGEPAFDRQYTFEIDTARAVSPGAGSGFVASVVVIDDASAESMKLFTPLGVASVEAGVIGTAPSRAALSMMVLPDSLGGAPNVQTPAVRRIRFERFDARQGDVP